MRDKSLTPEERRRWDDAYKIATKIDKTPDDRIDACKVLLGLCLTDLSPHGVDAVQPFSGWSRQFAEVREIHMRLVRERELQRVRQPVKPAAP